MNEFARYDWQNLATVGPPPRRTKESIIEEAKQQHASSPGVREQHAAFHEMSVFSELLRYHDIARHNKICFGHNFANVMKQSISVVANSRGTGKSKKVRFQEKRATVFI